MVDHDYVLSLADARAAQLAFAGGKGASLARLLAAGLPVPDAFVIATAAYQRFVCDNELEPSLLAVLQPATASQPATLETASRAIGELIMQAQMPAAASDAVRRAYAELGGTDQPVAVRSSATAEGAGCTSGESARVLCRLPAPLARRGSRAGSNGLNTPTRGHLP